jgi:hypothetical protein
MASILFQYTSNLKKLEQFYHSYSGSKDGCMEQGAIQWEGAMWVTIRFTGKELKPDFTQYTLHN